MNILIALIDLDYMHGSSNCSSSSSSSSYGVCNCCRNGGGASSNSSSSSSSSSSYSVSSNCSSSNGNSSSSSSSSSCSSSSSSSSGLRWRNMDEMIPSNHLWKPMHGHTDISRPRRANLSRLVKDTGYQIENMKTAMEN
ncbi:Hypothetical predicted protein [Octopus vulgaris]|uniref:Uncharacterized protein n=1 Tax=Octopus vulgaris TaxID=6645 RepID=A0AA36BJR7_OCTVU|nr:Hypothetical predicted protein [Octopus vulgaris]